MPDQLVVEAKGLRKIYGKLEAVADASFSLLAFFAERHCRGLKSHQPCVIITRLLDKLTSPAQRANINLLAFSTTLHNP
jgi:hypothetical protein